MTQQGSSERSPLGMRFRPRDLHPVDDWGQLTKKEFQEGHMREKLKQDYHLLWKQATKYRTLDNTKGKYIT